MQSNILLHLLSLTVLFQQANCLNSTCSSLICPDGMSCQEVQVSCFMPPCPPPKEVCVAEDSSLTCADIKCLEGQTCEQEIIRCVRAPCPQPAAQCVPMEIVPVPTCGDNEELKACGTACEPSCTDREPSMCTRQCLVNVCQCKQGFLRDQNSNRCVKQEHCLEQYLSCEERTCPDGTICRQAQRIFNAAPVPSKCAPNFSLCNDVQCSEKEFCDVLEDPECTSPPCSYKAQCITKPTDDPCAFVDCESGFVCVSEPVTCSSFPCEPITKCVPNSED